MSAASVVVPWDIYSVEDEDSRAIRRLVYRKGDRIPAKAAREAGLIPIESTAGVPAMETK